MTTINITAQTISAANGGFTGFNYRLVVPTANLNQAYSGTGLISVTIASFSTQNGTLDGVYIGHQGSGNVYNFDGNQVQLLIAGSASKTWSGTLTFTTDTAAFNYNPTIPLIVSMHFSGTTDTGQSVSGPSNCNQHFSGASQVSATSPTGSWTADSIWTWVSSIDLVETASDPGSTVPRNSSFRTVVLMDTTRPIGPLFIPAPAAVVYGLDLSLQKDRPFVKDYRTTLAATTGPVAPIPIPPVQTFVVQPDQQLPSRSDPSRALGSTTQPVLGTAFRTAVTPSVMAQESLLDERPRAPDYRTALAATTSPALIVQPPPPAQTPTFQFELTIQDDLGRARDYRTALASTTVPVGPLLLPTKTPSTYYDLGLLDDRAIARDYRSAIASTTVPVTPIFSPQAVVTQTLIGSPDRELPRRADYSRTLAGASPVVPPPPPSCFNVGYQTAPSAGAGNSYTAGYDFANGPYTMPQTGIVTTCSVWLDTSPAGTFRLGIYDSISASQPGNLLALTAPFTPIAGWNTQPVTFPITVNSGTVIFMGALNTGGASTTKADPTVGVNLYRDSGTNSVLDPVFQNPAILANTSFQLGAYATFCPTAPLTSNWFQTPYQANPIDRSYRVVLADTSQPSEPLSIAQPLPLTATPTYLGMAISGEVPAGGDYRSALASTCLPVSPAYAPQIGFPNQLFLNSLGVTTHIDQGFPESQYEVMFSYTGIRVTRAAANDYLKLIDLHNNTVSGSYPGVKSLLSGANPPSDEVVPGLALDAIGALAGFEGPNEPNNFTLTYNSVTGGDALSWVPVAEFQRDLHLAISGNATLSRYPVFGVSEAGAEFDNVGLQYNTIPVGAGTSFADGTVYQDYANIHNYVLGTSGTYAAGRPTTSFAAGNLPGGIDGRKGEYIGTTWSKGFPAYSVTEGPSIPFVSTETGADTGGASPLTQEQQGKLYVNIYLAGFQAQMATGQKQAFTGIYEMVDQEGSSDFKGLYTSAHVAKLSADYVHNMTTVLADLGPDPVLQSLDFVVTGETSTCHHLLLQKSDNTFYLILWGEEIVGGPTHNLTVTFVNQWNISVYDVVSGTSPVSTFASVSSVPVTVQDHAKILQITQVQTDAGPSQSRGVKRRRQAVFSTSSPTGPELLPTPAPQLLFYPGGLPREIPLIPNYRIALMSTTSPVGPWLLPTTTPPIVGVWVPNPDSTMPDWW